MNRDDADVRWLDVQPPKSVMYVVLGSEVPLRVELMHKLDHGLEMAGTRFLWALWKPRGGVPDMNVLPSGFQEHTNGHGLGAAEHRTGTWCCWCVLDALWT